MHRRGSGNTIRDVREGRTQLLREHLIDHRRRVITRRDGTRDEPPAISRHDLGSFHERLKIPATLTRISDSKSTP